MMNDRSDDASRLAAAEAQLALVRRMMALGTFEVVIDDNGSFRSAGDYVQLHGMPPDHVDSSYEDWLSRVHPQDRERAEKTVRAAIEGNSLAYAHEYRILRPDLDEVRWIRVRADIVRDAQGRARHIVGVQIDVTQEKLIEAELRESRERLLMSLRAACMGTYEYLPVDRRINLSPLSADVFGLMPGQAVDSTEAFYALLHPDDRAEHRHVFERAAIHGGDFHLDYRIVRPRDQRVAWIEEHGHGSRNRRDGESRVRGVHWDISERKYAAQALHESRERLRALIDGIPQLVWRADASGSWTWASCQWVSFTEVSEDASRGDGWLEAVHPRDRDRARQAWQRAPAEGEVRVDIRLIHAMTKHYRSFQMVAMPTRDADGAIVEWFGTCTDIEDQIEARRVLAQLGDELEKRVGARTRELRTAMESLTQEVEQRERVEERLRQSEGLKAIGQLTGGIAHDFNNMLQTISGSLGVIGILLQQGRTAEVEAYLDRARRGITRAAALTHRLLAFGRKQTLTPEPLSMDDVITSVEDLIQRTVGPEVNVEMKLNDGDWLILCDANQMESALLNLCVNARDAMPAGGWLTISTQERMVSDGDIGEEDGVVPGRFVVVSVSDTGVGMTTDVLARAFEPFFTTKPDGQGTGLGLSQIYGFVRQSGGFVRVESTPGKGTTVHLFFPFFSMRRGETEPTDAKPTVLLVEDEADVRELTTEQFRIARFRVMEAQNAEAAMRLLQSGMHFDVLVSDVRLPGGMDGVQLGEAARRLRPSLPIVLISGYAEGRTLTGAPLVDKPFEFVTLLDHVNAVLKPPPAPERYLA